MVKKMPPKNTLKKSVDRKLKRLIESKLMQVTLRIDGYLYDNKPILTKDAHDLKLEVCSYKRSCKNDERALQVIEKLSRILQGIIDKQNSSPVTIEELNTEPVVSNENATKDTNCSTNVCDEYDPTIKSDLEKIQNQDDEPIDKTVNNESIENNSTESVAVNPFPTKDKDGPVVLNSITNDKVCPNIIQAISNPIVGKTHAVLSNVDLNDIQKLIVAEKIKENNIKVNKEVNNITRNREIISTNNNTDTDNNTRNVLREESESILIFNEFNKYTASIEGSGVEKTINTPASASKQNLKGNKSTNPIPISKSTKVKRPRKGKVNVEQNKEINKKNETTTTKIYTETMDESARLYSKPQRKNTIDLSWIENIKYVREIQEDEFDSKMNWDDIDFSYN